MYYQINEKGQAEIDFNAVINGKDMCVQAIVEAVDITRPCDNEMCLDFEVVAILECQEYDEDTNTLTDCMISHDEIIAYINDLDTKAFTAFHRDMEYSMA